MAQLLQKKIVCISLAALLAACSTDNGYKRQLNDDGKYLKTPVSKNLKSASGMIIPVQFSDYHIPEVATEGLVGKALDIRPPTLALPLINGSRVQQLGSDKIIANITWDSSSLTPNIGVQILEIMKENNYPVIEVKETSLVTDWISWPRKDEIILFAVRYKIEWEEGGSQSTLTVGVIELRQGKEAVTLQKEFERYGAMMLNRLAYAIAQLQHTKTDEGNTSSINSFVVQNATDETGLAMMIVRAPYNNTWNALLAKLELIGMITTNPNRSQGTMGIKYYAPNTTKLKTLELVDPKLKNGEYTLQLGDLNNRTSLQFRDNKGQPIEESINNALVSLIQYALEQTSEGK